MSRLLPEIEIVMKSLIAEHRKLLAEVDAHQAAIRAMDVPAMEGSRGRQEAMRLRIATIDHRRRTLVAQAALAARLPTVTLSKLAELYPQQGPPLLALRDELKSVIQQVAERSHVAGRVANSVLGHLNTVVRLLAGAMQQAGVYTKQGVPKMSQRIGAIEAVG